MLNKIKKNYFILVYTFLFLYFIFNLFDGERGLISYFEKKNILIDLNNQKINLSNKIKDLEHKNSLLTDRIKRLQTNTIDLDFLDEQIRQKTGYVSENEVLIIFE